MSLLFGFQKATNRKTECYWLDIFGVRVLISYETPIAFNDYRTGSFRRANDWGPTTGRHMRECYVTNWDVIEDEDEFNKALNQAIMANILRDDALMKNLVTQAVTNKLVPEIA